MARSNGIKYKEVKNPNKPGRAPSGCVWVKEDGQLLRNKSGQLAYREMTDAERNKSPKPKKTRMRRKRAQVLEAAPTNALLNAKTYQDLSYDQLQNVAALVGDLLDKQRAVERKRLEAELAEVKEKLKQLS